MKLKVEFRIIDFAGKEWKLAVKLREDILRKPLGTIFSSEELEEEENHIHLIGLVNEELIATAVLVPDMKKLKMQRVVVLAKHRNLNIGSNMMDYCEFYAIKNGFKSIYCHARDSAVNFYLKNGYSSKGEYFEEDGIPHLMMMKQLL